MVDSSTAHPLDAPSGQGSRSAAPLANPECGNFTLMARYEAVQAMGMVEFDQRPYFRIFTILLDLGEPISGVETSSKTLLC